MGQTAFDIKCNRLPSKLKSERKRRAEADGHHRFYPAARNCSGKIWNLKRDAVRRTKAQTKLEYSIQ